MSSDKQQEKLELNHSDKEDSDSETIGYPNDIEQSSRPVFNESFPKNLVYTFDCFTYSYHITETLFKLKGDFDTWKWFNIDDYSGPEEVTVPVIHQRQTLLCGGPKHTNDIYTKLIEKVPSIKDLLIHIAVAKYKTFQYYVICMKKTSKCCVGIYFFPKPDFDSFLKHALENFSVKTSISSGVYIECIYYELWSNISKISAFKWFNIAFVILENKTKVSRPKKKFNFGKSMVGREQWIVYKGLNF